MNIKTARKFFFANLFSITFNYSWVISFRIDSCVRWKLITIYVISAPREPTLFLYYD
jgi:hypothetical protein